jgi:hypothetical protein
VSLSEHHINYLELQQILSYSYSYSLGIGYYRSYAKGGVCILAQEKLKFVSIDLEKYCKAKGFEVHDIKIYLDTKKICIIAT